MIVPKLETEICEYLHQLPLEQQRQVLDALMRKTTLYLFREKSQC